jgi:hypothetical protein
MAAAGPVRVGLMMATVEGLLPGDLVANGAVFITSCPHPAWEDMLLVIWRMEDNDSIRVDALKPDYEVGDIEPIEPDARAGRLAGALLPGWGTFVRERQ